MIIVLYYLYKIFYYKINDVNMLKGLDNQLFASLLTLMLS